MLKRLVFIPFIILMSMHVNAQNTTKNTCDCVKIYKYFGAYRFSLISYDTVFYLYHPEYSSLSCALNYGDSILIFNYKFSSFKYKGMCVIALRPKPILKDFSGLLYFDQYHGNIAYFNEPSEYIHIYNIFLQKKIDSVKVSNVNLDLMDIKNLIDFTGLKIDTIAFFLNKDFYDIKNLTPLFNGKTSVFVKIHYTPKDSLFISTVAQNIISNENEK